MTLRLPPLAVGKSLENTAGSLRLLLQGNASAGGRSGNSATKAALCRAALMRLLAACLATLQDTLAQRSMRNRGSSLKSGGG